MSCSLCLAWMLCLSTALADIFGPTARYQVCFTPYQNCMTHITSSIQRARSSIHIQAYSFTAKPIIESLKKAQSRGVKVQVILDKLHRDQPTLARDLIRHHIAVWIDHPAGIAHNKVMIIDQTQVITGSFNFSQAAQYRNIENVLMIRDQKLAARYLDNWYRRQAQSTPFKQPLDPALTHPTDLLFLLEKLQNWLMNVNVGHKNK